MTDLLVRHIIAHMAGTRPDSELSSLLVAARTMEKRSFEDGERVGSNEILLKVSEKVVTSALEISRLASNQKERNDIFNAIVKLGIDILQVDKR